MDIDAYHQGATHNSEGLVLRSWDGPQQVEGFISRRVMDDWVDPIQPYGV